LGPDAQGTSLYLGGALKAFFFATDYLSTQNRVNSGEIDCLSPEISSAGKKVIVIGGGDTGNDCVGTSWRQGALQVSQFEIMPEPPKSRASDNPWPQWPRVLRTSSSHEEGGVRRWNIDTLEFLPSERDPSSVGAIRCREVEWGTIDGKLKPVPKVGTEFVEPCDIVLLALGFTGPETGNLEFPTPLLSGGKVSEGLYVAGDAANGPSLVVRAMNDGIQVAKQVLTSRMPLHVLYESA
jgi:glutamate synthase (NADPH/NADH) small chain